MATTIVNGNRVFAQPGIDGGTFLAPNPVGNVLIVARMFNVQAVLVGSIASAGTFPTAAEVPVSIYNTATSSGGYIDNGKLVAGVNYSWIAIGVGG